MISWKWWRRSKRVERPSLAVGSTLRGYPGDHGYRIISAREARVRCSPHDSSRRTRRVGAPTTVFDQSRARLSLIRGLAEAFLSGSWELDGLVERGGLLLGRRYRWLRPLARRVLATFPEARGRE